ncbi:glycosyltransferase [Caenimonas sedimenti]|uniref:Glycosyltransferase n=1 Tax=Caenimonas sedimenti TaxID=2596921 RepID=A0A562ZVQ2_9BURK|nr:glycosyltransferase [Caenimonas sedimenti]
MSHGHGEHVKRLLAQLGVQAAGVVGHVVLTHNLPAAPLPTPEGGWPFRFTEVFNERPVGFGANHNRAFGHCQSAFFCVLNPDIEITEAATMRAVLECARQPGTGCAYPELYNPDGSRQQNEREVMTPWALLRRHVLRRTARRVDWASGAFLLVRADVWRALGGFDEGYFMYCEDTDFCLRLQLAGWRLARADARTMHAAAWGSRRPGRHMAWHVRSLLRLWTTPAFRRYLKARQ